jgi:hypothetical protein
LDIAFGIETVDTAFDFAEKINSLELTQKEISLFLAVVLTTSGKFK